MLLALSIPDLHRLVSLTTLLRLFTPIRPGTVYRGLSEADILAAVRRCLRHPLRMRNRPCLREGLLSLHLLRLAGYPVELHFGVYTSPRSREQAHCWVTFNGRNLTSPPEGPYVTILVWGRPEAQPAILNSASVSTVESARVTATRVR